jgi:diguanylate cyclase (GGDEF)-like protein
MAKDQSRRYNDSMKNLRASGAEALLSTSALFSSFSPEELAYLAEKSEILELKDGQTVFEPGAPGDRLYIVASGSVLVYAPGGNSVLAELVAGDSFGELELLTGTVRNAFSRAEGETKLLAFPAGGVALKDALAGRPAVAARILRSFLLVVSGRTREANALVKENSPIVRELKRQVYGDKLTGLYNKAYLEENLPSMLSSPLALIMMKPDNFKDINDRFGHEAGDAALVLMAGELGRAVGGKTGIAVRYMGNELAAILPGRDREGALEAARFIQDRLSSLDLSSATGDPTSHFSMSLGIALYPEHGADAAALIAATEGLPLVGRGRGGSLILFPEDAA